MKAKHKGKALQKEFLKSEIKLSCSIYFRAFFKVWLIKLGQRYVEKIFIYQSISNTKFGVNVEYIAQYNPDFR